MALGVPAAYYLWPRGSKKDRDVSNAHGANQEYKFAAEGNQENKGNDAAYDEVRSFYELAKEYCVIWGGLCSVLMVYSRELWGHPRGLIARLLNSKDYRMLIR